MTSIMTQKELYVHKFRLSSRGVHLKSQKIGGHKNCAFLLYSIRDIVSFTDIWARHQDRFKYTNATVNCDYLNIYTVSRRQEMGSSNFNMK